jgi:hypothetical protein
VAKSFRFLSIAIGAVLLALGAGINVLVLICATGRCNLNLPSSPLPAFAALPVFGGDSFWEALGICMIFVGAIIIIANTGTTRPDELFDELATGP